MGETVFSRFEALVLEEVPLIDVRAPVEFEAGAFPTAVNLPLMNDWEREQVGICYKQEGHDAAVVLGHKLVSGEIKQARLNAWITFLQQYPDAMLYCFRGGMRSQIVQEWILAETGREVPRLEGGYKAFRNYLIEQLDPQTLVSRPLVLGGRTGVGKTLLLRKFKNCVDLEAIAHHRGSAFGRFTSPQPTPINFENALAWAFVQHRAAGFSCMLLEDEGRNVGDRYLPQPLVDHFSAAEVIVLERSLEERVQITFQEYVVESQQEYTDRYGDEGLARWLESMEHNFYRIRKRLGGLRYQELSALLREAHESGETQRHTVWIEQLLREYYDPMYDYQLRNKSKNIVFRGGEEEIIDYLEAQEPGTFQPPIL